MKTENDRVSAREFGDQLLQRLLGHVLDTVPDAAGAGLSLVTDSGPRSVSGIGVAALLDPVQWERREGPLVEALDAGASVVMPGPDREFGPSRWPALAEVLEREQVDWPAGVVVAMGEWGSDHDRPVIFSVYTSVVPESSGVAEVDRFEGLLASALAVVEYCAGEELRAEQMLQMVQYRRVIEQAKGMVMAATSGDAGSAFTTLARASQHFNIRLRNLAIALVEHVGGAPAEGPEDPEQIVVPTATDRRTAAQVWAALTTPSPRERPTA